MIICSMEAVTESHPIHSVKGILFLLKSFQSDIVIHN